MFRATGCTLNTSFMLGGLAEAYVMLGQPTESLSKLDEAMRFIEATNERFYEAGIYRVRGEFCVPPATMQRRSTITFELSRLPGGKMRKPSNCALP